MNYLTDRVDFAKDIEAMRRLVDFRRILIVVDAIVFEALPGMKSYARATATTEGIDILFVPYTGAAVTLPADLDPRSDVVMIAGQARLDSEEIGALIDGSPIRAYPPIAFKGAELVRFGALAADSPHADWDRIARRNALNMQAVLLGESAASLPVLFEGRRELTINMRTAAAIGLSPSLCRAQ